MHAYTKHVSQVIAGGCTTENVEIDNVRSLRNSDFEETARLLKNMKVRELRKNEFAEIHVIKNGNSAN